jgi:hypothetical protein
MTWYKISTLPKIDSTSRPLTFKVDGEPYNGFLEIIVDGKTSRFKIVDGKVE